MITAKTKTTHQPIFGKEARWRRNGVDWGKFSEAVEADMLNLPEEQNLTKR